MSDETKQPTPEELEAAAKEAQEQAVAEAKQRAKEGGTVKLKGGNVTFEGVEYDSKKGIVEVPAAAAAVLVESHGFALVE